MFSKILIANRGEIALRIIRACKEMGIATVAVYSQADRDAMHVSLADESYCIGPSPVAASYLNIGSILQIAVSTSSQAIHPGYGLLSENAKFAELCGECGITFIGPSPDTIRKMGDKETARRTMTAAGVPVVAGSGILENAQEALSEAERIGYPVMLKASNGGGGRGMRRCDTVEEVGVNFDLVKAEAKKAFGNDDIFMEKFLVEPKHIEVQILGDKHGNVVHLFERDCSLQRRYQKVVEFAPAWSVPQETVEALRRDAVKIAKSVGYVSAGTVEFLVDKSGTQF